MLECVNMKISIRTLGCKLNQAESEEIKNELKKLGHFFAPFCRTTDIAIIRACAVTAGASQTARELIRQAKKRGSFVIASGCLENKELPEIDYVAETPGDIISKVSTLSKDSVSFANTEDTDEPAQRTRAMIKIQNGCNFNCAYCAIPNFRGRSVSTSDKEIISKIINAQNQGCREVVLTGVNICQYNYRGLNLSELLRQILQITSIERIRLGSLDPRLITKDIYEIFANPRLMPHWHLSLQSGSDSILSRMKRGYTTKQYYDIVRKMRLRYPLFSFTTDIIVGFPGETDSEFRDSLSFVKKVGFSKVHVFPYSKRPNTLAAGASHQVHDKMKSDRVKQLINYSDAIADKYRAKLSGKKRSILFEHQKNGCWYGYAPEYVQVKYKSRKNLKNTIVEVKINPA